ncbi:hypothetical protein [Kitasatospora purpeofusca]|uniref:hypothetical protein n=1 Tax=Kitasatospora purpeofusca TaxID=67352 RepID=UPI0036507C83
MSNSVQQQPDQRLPIRWIVILAVSAGAAFVAGVAGGLVGMSAGPVAGVAAGIITAFGAFTGLVGLLHTITGA